MAQTRVRERPVRLPPELINILGVSAAVLGVLAIGSAIAAVLPADSSAWLAAAGYLTPAGLAYAAFWWISQER